MTSPDETVQLADLHAAAAAAEAVVDVVPADAWAAATPCAEWDLTELVAHVSAGNHLFAALVDGRPPRSGEPITDPAAPADVFHASVAEVLRAFAAPGALDRPVTLPIGTLPGSVAMQMRIVELLVHGWDVAAATGRELAVPDDVAARALEFSRGLLQQLPPDRQPFAASVPVSPDAPSLQQLLGLLGRDVGWRAGR